MGAEARVRTSGPPSRIGARYDVLERLGHGGMATVYRVRDTRRGGEVALKQLNLSADASRAREMTALFEREFYTLAQLSHPSVIAVYDFGLDVHGPYYTMELLDGGDITSCAPLEPLEACRLFAQVCSSLSLLHSRRFVHRDVSPRNVRLTPGGRAKLIDFGALVEMGPCAQTIGTPAFVAPEVVQHVALDARTDLFSLGATLYFALTGRPAFAVRSFAELREAWRAEITPPSKLVPAVPPALDNLVLSLLRIDPSLRPNSAFETMQRLAAIAGVSQAESELAKAAYLTTPRLVGREHEQRRFRKHLRKVLGGQGSSLLFEAAPGLGRSRLLDACVLEAKTVGAVVARTGGAGASQPFGAAAALAVELLEELPDAAVRCGELSAAPGLLPGADERPLRAAALLERFQQDRQRTLAGLARWIGALCRERLIVLAIDDVERVDEPSLALLAALASNARELKLVVVLSAALDVSTTAPAALGVLRSHAAAQRLEPLTRDETETLFTSVFGHTPHVGVLSGRLHELAGGSPRESLALAQQLLAQGSIRYADGHWVLPEDLSLHHLPASLEDALQARIAALPPLALRLAQTQALAVAQAWTRADYVALAGSETSHVDAAIAALRGAGIIASEGHVYSLAKVMRGVLVSKLSAEEAQQRHLALAEMCARSESSAVLEVRHLLLGGAIARGLDRLNAIIVADGDRSDLWLQAGLDAYETASCLEHAFALSVSTSRPPRERHDLAGLLVAASVGAWSRLHREYGPTWLAQIERDSGLSHYRAHPELEPGARLMAALTAAAQQHEATPSCERVYSVEEAIKYLARYVVMSMAVGARTRNMRLLVSLPGLLEPFAALSPVLQALWQDAIAVNELSHQGQLEHGVARCIAVYDKLGAVEGDQLKYVEEIRGALAFGIASAELVLGRPSVEHWLDVMEHSPQQQVPAAYLRSIVAVYAGDLAASERHRKAAEILSVQLASAQMFGAPLHIELTARAMDRDLAGVRRVSDRIALLAAEEPGWLAPQHLAQGLYQLLRGDLTAALAAFERSFALNRPEQAETATCFNTWAQAASGYVATLVELDRAEEARLFGLRACEHCRVQGANWLDNVERELAVAEASVGAFEDAARRLHALIERNRDRSPARLSWLYEARARVAIRARDEAAARSFAELATRDLQGGAGHRVLQRHARMLEEARRAGIDLQLAQSGFEDSVLGGARASERSVIATRALQEVQRVAPNARPLRILELVCEAVQAEAGQLYLASGERLTPVAAKGEAAERALDDFAAGYFRQQLEIALETSAVTEITGGVTAEPMIGSWTSPRGTAYRLIALTHFVDGDLAFAGLLALELAPNQRVPPHTHIIARALAPELAACAG